MGVWLAVVAIVGFTALVVLAAIQLQHLSNRVDRLEKKAEGL